MDSIPIVAFTGQVPDAPHRQRRLPGSRQRRDHPARATKHNFLVKDGEDLAPIIQEAFHIAVDRPAGARARGPAQGHPGQGVRTSSGRTRPPALLQPDLRRPSRPDQAGGAARSCGPSGRCSTWAAASSPSDAHAELRELAELAQLPVTQTLMGLGAFPVGPSAVARHAGHARDLLRQHGRAPLRRAGRVGARFDDRVTGRVDAFSPHAEIIHIDIDPSSISKNIKVDVPIVGDCRRVLRQAGGGGARGAQGRAAGVPGGAPAVGGADRRVEARQPAPLRVERRRHQAAVRDPGAVQRSPAARRSSSPAWASTRCGRPSTTGSSTRACGAPRAGSAPWATACPPPWACRPANPGKLVINIDGDGSFPMNSQELATCFAEGLPVKTVIINNSGHGMVRQWQRIIYKERFCAIDLPGIPDWVKLAEAYGCVGLRVTKPSEVVPAIEKMLEHAGPGHPRRVRRQGRVRVPDGAGGRRQHRHDPGAAHPRGAGEGRQVADGVLMQNGSEPAQAHDRRPGREQVRRPLARGRALLGPRLQHREPVGGGDAGPQRVAHDPGRARRRVRHRAGDQAAPQADRRDQGDRPHRREPRGARAGADPGQRRAAAPGGDPPHGRHLPGQGGRRDARHRSSWRPPATRASWRRSSSCCGPSASRRSCARARWPSRAGPRPRAPKARAADEAAAACSEDPRVVGFAD